MSKDLIEKLRFYRLEKQLTQKELAKKLGVHRITLNRWLKRRLKPRELEKYRIKKLVGETK